MSSLHKILTEVQKHTLLMSGHIPTTPDTLSQTFLTPCDRSGTGTGVTAMVALLRSEVNKPWWRASLHITVPELLH